MPVLREWLMHFPTDWTPIQGKAYAQDVTMALVQAATPILNCIGPQNTAAVFLTVILNIARANPVYHENIKDMMAGTYNAIEALDPFKHAGTAQ